MNRRVAAAIVVAVGSAVGLVVTAGDYGLTWDEPVYVGSARKVAEWFAGIGSEGLGASLRDERLQECWVFARTENFNLPVPVLISCVAHQIGHRWLNPLISYRLGHCVLMACTLGVLFHYLATHHGWEVACVGAGSLLLMPHVFAHAHLNATDVPVSCFWVLAFLAWVNCKPTWTGGLLPAVVCGLGLATKATFGFALVLLVVWTIAVRRWAWWRAGVTVMVLAPLLMLALCPMWWADPLSRIATFLQTLSHADQQWATETYYLREVYSGGLPWHNGWVTTAVCTPPWTLALAFACVPYWLRHRDGSIALWVMGALVLPALRMNPHTPAHDGTRLMLPSIFCLGPLAGFGFVGIAERLRSLTDGRRGPIARWSLVVVLLAVGVVAVVGMHPYEMSYYSECAGGLHGAVRLGFEATYWFDAYTPAALREVQARIPAGSRVWTFPPYAGYPLLREWGMWRSDLTEGDLGEQNHADYLVLYSRFGWFPVITGMDRIYENKPAIWSLKCRGVQLVGLYSARTMRATPARPHPGEPE